MRVPTGGPFRSDDHLSSRTMKSLPALLVSISLVAGAGFVVETRRVSAKSAQANAVEDAPAATPGGKTHRPTVAMVAAAAKVGGTNAPPFLVVAPGGKALSQADLSASRPLVLVFVQDGCPCSEAEQPFLNVLRDAYGDRAEFAAVFDGDAPAATRWATANHARFTMLPDPSLELVRRYGVECSTCVVLVDRGGKVAKAWPGYSAEMLHDLNDRLAVAGGVVKRPLTFAGAPPEMHSGCSY
jgi:peroxiredoxin